MYNISGFINQYRKSLLVLQTNHVGYTSISSLLKIINLFCMHHKILHEFLHMWNNFCKPRKAKARVTVNTRTWRVLCAGVVDFHRCYMYFYIFWMRNNFQLLYCTIKLIQAGICVCCCVFLCDELIWRQCV